MKKLLVFAIFVIAAFGIWIGGIRVVVIQPIGAIPEGITAVVMGVGNLRLIDSPDAICHRRQGGVSLLCRGFTAGAIAKQGTILLRFPYSETLFRLTGGPFRDD